MSHEKNLGWLIYAENDITEWYWLSRVRFIFAFWNGNLQNSTVISWGFLKIPISRSLCKAFWPDFGCWLPAKFLRVSLGEIMLLNHVSMWLTRKRKLVVQFHATIFLWCHLLFNDYIKGKTHLFSQEEHPLLGSFGRIWRVSVIVRQSFQSPE